MLALKIILFVFISQYHVFALDSCGRWLTCKECIRDPSLCVWCTEDNFTGPRCKIANSTNDDKWCVGHIENPSNWNSTTKDEMLSLDLEHIIQIRPQQIEMRLRPGGSQKFEFSYQGAKDLPVDLYFLMDASYTMDKLKAATAKQAKTLYNSIQNMTKNVYMGFGSFVDKPVLPFKDPKSTEIYSFRHRLSLTDNFTRFQHVVSNTPTGINRDPQEGGLDGLAQVMVCKDLIGWRNESRKIVIYMSDGSYHSAGDARSAGIFQPYDGHCHTKNELYTKETEMDYPSPGMINKIAVERNMVILFFVHGDVIDTYDGLSSTIRGSQLSVYSKDYENLVKTIKDIYEKISTKITINVRVKSGRLQNFEITFQPNCTTGHIVSDCDVEVGKEKKIEGTVKLLEFIDQTLDIDIGIESIEDKLNLQIKAIKMCDCEAKDREELNSTSCNGEKRSCGICDCGTKRYGEKCACVKNELNTFNETSTCKPKGSSTECSDHGSCICGACNCFPGFSGKFCDCSMESCPRDGSGKLCSGHGKCICGSCVCTPEWTGKVCDCSRHNCEIDGKVCSGRGYCNCGICECNKIADWDARNQNKGCKLIEHPETHNRQCRKLENCAYCQRKNDYECISCNQIYTKLLPTLTEEYINNSVWNVCPNLKVGVGCYSKFAYRYNDENHTLELVVELEKNCAETYYMFGAVLALIIFLVGLAIIMGWKFMIDARDRKEYEQFLKSQTEEGNYANILYQEPHSSFVNPNFRKRSVNKVE